MIQFKEFQLDINHPNIPSKLIRKYDKNINVGTMKQNLKDEFYLNGVVKIELQLPTGLNLKDDKIIDKIYYSNLKVLIEVDQNQGQIQVLNQIKLQDIMEQISSRKKYIQVLSITNFQRYNYDIITSLKLSDQFYVFKQSIFDYYFQNDPNRMEFAEINTQIESKNIKFMRLNPFVNFTQENYPFSNQNFLQKALTQIFEIQWKSIYKLVIVFTDSKYVDIFKEIRDLYQRGFKLIFISFSDINQQWLKGLSNAYIVKNAENCNLSDKDFLKEIQGIVSETLTQTLTPRKETTYKIETEYSIFQTQSFVKIILNNEINYDENELETETMQYFIPKIENKKNLDKILKNKSQIKVYLTQDGNREVKYAKNIFNKGSLKEVYECIINSQNYVLKQPLKSQGYKNEDEVISEIQNHLLAYELFSQFYQRLYEKKEIIKVGFGEIFILKNKLDRYFILEPKYNGEVVKFNSNGGFIRDEIDHFNQISQAFSVFSYVYSDQNYMVLDIQGYQQGDYLTLSDPAIQTFRNDFSKTDLGKPTCDQYLAQWENKKRIGSEYLSRLQIL